MSEILHISFIILKIYQLFILYSNLIGNLFFYLLNLAILFRGQNCLVDISPNLWTLILSALHFPSELF